jgi:DNA-binding NarL/FixJ family response regulator
LWDDGPVLPSVLIVDDHGGFRSRARLLLESGGFKVLGEASDGASAIQAACQLRPQLVLLDVQLPDMDGFAVACELACFPNPPDVILISSRDASDYRDRLIATSARGFIAKADLTVAAIGSLLAM